MSSKNFIIKNGLTIGSTEVINSSGIVQGSAVNEAIDDRLNSTLTAGSGIGLTYDDAANTLTITGNVGDITGVNAGAGLTGTATSGDATLNIGAGTGITVNADDIAVNIGAFDTDDLSEGSSNLYMTTERVQDIAGGMFSSNTETGITATYQDSDGTIDLAVSLSSFDTDDLSEGSSNLYYTNARADARVNLQTGSNLNLSSKDTDDLSEGSSNLYFTNERVDDRVNALLTEGTGITTTYDDASNTLTLATTITQYADSDARGAISVTDSGGDGSLAYNNSNGVITYTGPSASETRAHFSAGTGVAISSGQVSIGQAVATSSNVTFNDLVVSGDLTVNGSTTTVSSTNTTVEDSLLELGNGTTGSPSNDAGIVIERGDESNVFMGWDDSASRFIVATTTATGASTGALSLTEANFRAGQISTSYANNSGGVARNIYQSTSAPQGSDGAVGDLWILYS